MELNLDRRPCACTDARTPIIHLNTTHPHQHAPADHGEISADVAGVLERLAIKAAADTCMALHKANDDRLPSVTNVQVSTRALTAVQQCILSAMIDAYVKTPTNSPAASPTPNLPLAMSSYGGCLACVAVADRIVGGFCCLF